MQPLNAPWRVSLLVLIAIAGLAPFAAHAQSPTNPLPKLLSKPGNAYLCFRRSYDEAHLKRHPGQITTKVLLALAPSKDSAGQAVWMKLQLHQRPYQKGMTRLANVGASCGWSVKANRDTSGRRLLKTYPREDGFACLAMYDNQVAEEAGTLMLDLARDGRTVTLHLDEWGIGLWGTLPEHSIQDEKTGEWKGGQPPLKLGPEDRVFRLTRVDPAECQEMEKAIDLQY